MFGWLKKPPQKITAGEAKRQMHEFLKEISGKSTAVIPLVCKKVQELGTQYGIDYETVSMADEYLRHRILDLVRNFFESEEPSAIVSSTIGHYCAVFSTAYVTAVENGGLDQTRTVVASVRAMRNMALQRRMFRIGYREPRDALHAAMLTLFTQSLQTGTADQSVTPYVDEEEGSVRSEYAMSALFETAPLQSLSQEEIEYLWRVILPYADRIPVKSSASGIVPFPIGEDGKTYVKLPANVKAAYHVGPGIPTFEGMDAIAQGRKDSKALWKPGQYLPKVNEGRLVEMAGKVLATWKGQQPKRRSEREKAKALAPVFIAHGFELVRKLVAFSSYVNAGGTLETHDAFRLGQLLEAVRFEKPVSEIVGAGSGISDPLDTLDMLERIAGGESTHRWHVNDRSDTGLGLMASGNHPWLVVGALVAIREGQETTWRVGVVRRVSLHDHRNSVGIELLPPSALAVGIKEYEGDSRDRAEWFRLFDGIVVEGTVNRLIVPPRTVKGKSYWAFTPGNRRRYVSVVSPMVELEGAEEYACLLGEM